jgi:hypothetical protein
VRTRTQHSVALGDVMSQILDRVYEERSIPVTFCDESMRRLSLEHQGTYRCRNDNAGGPVEFRNGTCRTAPAQWVGKLKTEKG